LPVDPPQDLGLRTRQLAFVKPCSATRRASVSTVRSPRSIPPSPTVADNREIDLLRPSDPCEAKAERKGGSALWASSARRAESMPA
jgi:hypothetical protein